jgi:peroxiredoxin 2/4
MAVGRAYGMIDDTAVDSTAVRSTYFIDPEGIVRAITTYPYNVGRSVSEMLRLLQALQAVSGGQNVAPENWHPGQPLLLPPALTAGNIAGRGNWFCQSTEQA